MIEYGNSYKNKDEIKQTLTLEQQTISKVCDDVIMAMINGLPEEAHTIEVFSYVLNKSKEMLHNKVISFKDEQINNDSLESTHELFVRSLKNWSKSKSNRFSE